MQFISSILIMSKPANTRSGFFLIIALSSLVPWWQEKPALERYIIHTFSYMFMRRSFTHSVVQPFWSTHNVMTSMKLSDYCYQHRSPRPACKCSYASWDGPWKELSRTAPVWIFGWLPLSCTILKEKRKFNIPSKFFNFLPSLWPKHVRYKLQFEIEL